MNNIEVEKAVLGCIITQPLILLDIPKKLDLFSDEKNQVIFKKLIEFSENNIEPDIVSLHHDLKREDISLLYLQEIITGDYFIGNIKSYIKSLVDFYEYRKFSFMAGKILVDIKNNEDLNDIKSEIMQSLEDDIENIDLHTKNLKETLRAMIEHIDNKKKGKVGKLKTGYEKIDFLLHEFSEKSLNVIAGRPSMGKTTLALNLLWKMFTEQKKKIALLSFEMSKIDILNKIFGIECNLNVNFDMNEKDYEKLKRFSKRYIDNEDFIINDSSSMTLQEISFWIKKQKLKHKIDIVFIDYLDFIEKSKEKNLNTSEKIGIITKGLKKLAKEEDLYIFLIAQLNRDNEKRTNKKPSMSDLKASGDIEQDADCIIFVHRDDYYEEKKDREDFISEETEIIFAKNRNGSTFSKKLHFNMRYSKFSEM